MIFALLLFATLCLEATDQPLRRHIVRVLIDSKPIDTHDHWSFNTENQELIAWYKNPLADDPDTYKKIHKKNIRITLHTDHLSVNGKSTHAERLLITNPVAHTAYYEKRPYKGVFEVRKDDKNWLLIHHVDLEEYVSCVVRWESWPGWPLEVNKICAVLARTYVIERLNRHKKRVAPYDIKSTNAHQTYKGTHDCANIHQATTETTALIAAHEKKPIIAMYDSCCGGVIPAQLPTINFAKAPYLARAYACTFCADCKIYRWQKSFPKKQLIALLKETIPGITRIDQITGHTDPQSGYLISVTITSNKGKKKLTGKEMYHLCKDIKSFCYTVTEHKDRIDCVGKGYGHHMGMCQWGARAMIKQGTDWKSVLKYYYPGIHFMKVVGTIHKIPTDQLAHELGTGAAEFRS